MKLKSSILFLLLISSINSLFAPYKFEKEMLEGTPDAYQANVWLRDAINRNDERNIIDLLDHYAHTKPAVNLNMVINAEHDSLLIWAMKQDFHHLTDKLLNIKDKNQKLMVNVNQDDIFQQTALFLAIKFDNGHIFNKLLSLKNPDETLVVNVNHTNTHNNNPLLYALIIEKQNFAQKLLSLTNQDNTPIVNINVDSSS